MYRFSWNISLFANEIDSGLGLLVMFMFVALGVGFIITSGLNYSASKRKLNDRPFDQEVKQEARKQLEDYEKSFRFGLVLGISACILSVTPFFLMEAILYIPSGLALGLFFAAVALEYSLSSMSVSSAQDLPKWPMAFTLFLMKMNPDHGQRNTFMENPQEKFAF